MPLQGVSGWYWNLSLGVLIPDVGFPKIDPPPCLHAYLLARWNLSTCLNLLQVLSARNTRATTEWPTLRFCS